MEDASHGLGRRDGATRVPRQDRICIIVTQTAFLNPSHAVVSTHTGWIAGGPLFSTRMRAAAVRDDWHIWADTYAMVNKRGGYLGGGRGDELAVQASLPRVRF